MMQVILIQLITATVIHESSNTRVKMRNLCCLRIMIIAGFVDDSYFYHYCKIVQATVFLFGDGQGLAAAAFLASLKRAKKRKAKDAVVQTIMCKHELLAESLVAGSCPVTHF